MLAREDLRVMQRSETIDSGDPAVGTTYNRSDPIACLVCKACVTPMVDRQQPYLGYDAHQNCYGVFFAAGAFTDYNHYAVGDIIRKV